MHNVSDILARPEAYGIVFHDEIVRQGGRGDKGVPFTVPILAIVDNQVFEEKFPGLLTAVANGQSTRVVSQRIGRNNADKLDAEAIKVLNIQWLLGIRAKAATRQPQVIVKFAGPNGQHFATELEAQQAWMAFMAEQNAK